MPTLNVGCGGRPLDKASFEGDVRIDLEHFKAVNMIADAHHLPFRDRSFYWIYCYEALEHFNSPFLALKEIDRVLKWRGEVEISIPNVWFWHKIARFVLGEREPYDLPDHKQAWDFYEFERLIRQTNLKIVKFSFGDWYPRKKRYSIEDSLPDCFRHTHLSFELMKEIE